MAQATSDEKQLHEHAGGFERALVREPLLLDLVSLRHIPVESVEVGVDDEKVYVPVVTGRDEAQ